MDKKFLQILAFTALSTPFSEVGVALEAEAFQEFQRCREECRNQAMEERRNMRADDNAKFVTLREKVNQCNESCRAKYHEHN